MKKNTPNEYKIIKSTEMDETESLTGNNQQEESKKHMQEMKNEIINLHGDDDTEHIDSIDNIDDLKHQVLYGSDD